ncbi:CDGSH iron-sulfur domain-containing protein [Embleya sp. NPDC001921]
MLIEGPVEVLLADGSTASSDRRIVALCACHRTRRPPWCDTSHRPHRRPGEPQAAASTARKQP